MKLLSRAGTVCVVSMLLAACQSTPLQDLQSGLSSLDMNLNSSSYVVRAGETLETIAFRYNTSVANLQRMNPQASGGVYSGMHIVVRESSNQSFANRTEVANATVLPSIQERTVSATTSATQTNQAVPLSSRSSDNYLLGAPSSEERVLETTRRDSASIPQIVRATETGYVEQPGYPVEEIIDDENFTLPTSNSSVANELQKFVGSWHWPMAGQLAREYDPRRPNGQGIEIVGMPGQQVHAVKDGVVDLVARSPDGVGKVVIVRHADNYLSVYSNTKDLFVSIQDTVRQGDPIASLGANSNDETLLRFEISKDGKLLNPMDFLTPL